METQIIRTKLNFADLEEAQKNMKFEQTLRFVRLAYIQEEPNGTYSLIAFCDVQKGDIIPKGMRKVIDLHVNSIGQTHDPSFKAVELNRARGLA